MSMTERVGDIAVRLDGDRGPWLILSNGIASDVSLWDGVVALLQDRMRILRHDWPGHGDSPSAGQPLDLGGYAALLLEVVAQQGISRAHFAGVSMGAMVSAEAALRAPGIVSGLTWCNALADAGPDYAAFWRDRASVVTHEGMEPIADATLDRWLSPGAAPELRARARAMILRTSAPGFAQAALALAGLSLGSRLPGLAMPCGFLTGGLDGAAPPQAVQALAGAVPGATFTCLDGIAHLSPLEAPQAVADQICADMARSAVV